MKTEYGGYRNSIVTSPSNNWQALYDRQDNVLEEINVDEGDCKTKLTSNIRAIYCGRDSLVTMSSANQPAIVHRYSPFRLDLTSETNTPRLSLYF